MRRIGTLVLAGIIAALAAPSLAQDGKERTATRDYTIARGNIQFNPHEVAWMGTQAEIFRARSGERSLTISLADNSGNPVRGRVQVGTKVVQFCAQTAKPIRVKPRQKIQVSAIFGSCGNGVSVATEGTISATFSK